MRLSVLVSVCLATLLVSAATASARPIKGGRYSGDVTFAGDRCRNCVRLTVANDGGELQGYSAVDLTHDWRWEVSCTEWFPFDAWTLDDRYRVRIRSDGTFSRSIRYLRRLSVRIAGRFSSNGRRVRGTLSVRGGRADCRLHGTMRLNGRLSWRRAPVAGRWSRCDPYVVGRGTRYSYWAVFDLDVGCTTARQAARAWLTDPSCRGLTLGMSCTAGGLSCGPVDRGQRAPPDQVRCVPLSAGGPVVEFLESKHCDYDAGVDTWTKNVACEEALELGVAFFSEENVDCLDDDAECILNGYSCRLEDGTDTSFIYRCRSGERFIVEFRVSG
jgi:hypothetical protein